MTVLVYTKPSCVQCNATFRELDKHGVDYQKLDATQPEVTQEIRELGYSSVPVVVAGDQHWNGFRPDRIAGLVT